MVHSDDICNNILELQRQFSKQGRGCNLTVFETICNFREGFENKVSKA